jgi:hypothetical protein
LLAVAINGKLYAAQGLLPGFKPAGLVYEYDPARDAWTQKKPMPHPVHHAAVTALNGKMYLFGGFDLPAAGPPGWNPVNDVWEYDPATDGWQSRAPMPTARGGSMAAVVSGKIYVIGGAGPMPGASSPVIRPRQPQRSLGTVEVRPGHEQVARLHPDAHALQPHGRRGRERQYLRNRWATERGVYHRLSGQHQLGANLRSGDGLLGDQDPHADTAQRFQHGSVERHHLRCRGRSAERELPRGVSRVRGLRSGERYLVAASLDALPRHEAIMAVLGNRMHVAGGSVQSAIVLPKGLS